ncbi:MAG: type IV pilin protein [Halieaceae bacterium]
MKTKRPAGFTLIELLIALVIIGILAMVALPTYKDSVRKSGRTAAKGALLDIALRQEQYFLNNRGYSTTLTALGLPDPYLIDKKSDMVGSTDQRRVYKVTLANTSNTSFDAVATPQLDQTADGCGSYTLNADGTRSVSGTVGSDNCW